MRSSEFGIWNEEGKGAVWGAGFGLSRNFDLGMHSLLKLHFFP